MPETLLPPLRVLGLAPDLVEYHDAWDAQRALQAHLDAAGSGVVPGLPPVGPSEAGEPR